MAFELVSRARAIRIDRVISSRMASIIYSGGEEARNKKLPLRLSLLERSIVTKYHCVRYVTHVSYRIHLSHQVRAVLGKKSMRVESDIHPELQA